MAKGTGKRPTNGVGNYMAKTWRPIIGNPEGSREQRRAAARLAKGKGRKRGAYRG